MSTIDTPHRPGRPSAVHPARGHRVLSAVTAVMAVASAAGAVGIAGGGVDFGDTVESRLPFQSMPLAGLALFTLVTLPMGVATWQTWRGGPRAGVTALAAGALLMGWIVVQLLFIRTFSALQPICFAYGATVAALGWLAGRADGRR
jgi:hypothetical protein